MTYAFTAINTETGSTIGVAFLGESGYLPLANMPKFTVYSEAQDYADKLNHDNGLTGVEAWKIVASSMR